MADEAGYLLGGKALKQVQQLIAERFRRFQNDAPRSSRYNGGQTVRAVVLDAALDVATHALTAPTSALATRCVWSRDAEEYLETETQITVWNHSESDSYEVDTFGLAHWIDGHWWFMGDCGPMAAR